MKIGSKMYRSKCRRTTLLKIDMLYAPLFLKTNNDMLKPCTRSFTATAFA